jgi:hypothetical protein
MSVSDFRTYGSQSDNPYLGGGRVILLFLLFFLSLYSFYKAGIAGFALAFGAVPIMVIAAAMAFKNQMFTFWLLFVVNYLVFFLTRMRWWVPGIPTSVPNEGLEMLLIALAVIDAGIMRFEKFANNMFLALLIWGAYCTLEVLNNTCDLGLDFGVWYSGARLMAFQLIYAFIVCSIYVDSPQRIMTFLRLWGIMSLFAAFWCWKQQTFGFNGPEKQFLIVAARTHIVNGITRYFSIFSDAANFGINMAATAALFYVVALTSKIKADKIFFLIVALACTKSFFASGTRTAIFCLLLGFMVYVVLSKSVKTGIALVIAGILFVSFMMFTTIGNGNSQIRRMRSGFNPEDASANVRKVNQAAMAKYLKEAPWGIGLGVDYSNVPVNNKFRKLSTIPPDSEYVYIWVHTGAIGITVFLATTALMWLSACWVVFFRLKNKSLHGIGAGLCSAFLALQLGGYGNQVLMQFPNVFLFYGGLSLVFVLPRIEKEYEKYEEERFAAQEERKRLKAEKKAAERV